MRPTVMRDLRSTERAANAWRSVGVADRAPDSPRGVRAHTSDHNLLWRGHAPWPARVFL